MLVKVRRGETEYGIGAIPLGGYVKITGMNPEEEIPPEVAHRAYYRQPVWKRIVVIAAGPAMNLLIAFLDPVAGCFHGQRDPDRRRPRGRRGRARHAAAAAALQPGDRIVSVDGGDGDSADAARSRSARHRCAGTPADGCPAATPARVVVVRGGEPMTLDDHARATTAGRADAARLRVRLRARLQAPRTSARSRRRARASAAMWNVTERRRSRRSASSSTTRRRARRSRGVVGSYETTRQAFDVRHRARARDPRADLAVAGDRQPVPVPAARRRPHLLGAGREGARPRRSRSAVMERASVVGFVLVIVAVRRSACRTTSAGCTGEGFGVREGSRSGSACGGDETHMESSTADATPAARARRRDDRGGVPASPPPQRADPSPSAPRATSCR